jgi:peptide/nickel transport system substrate-binding protein
VSIASGSPSTRARSQDGGWPARRQMAATNNATTRNSYTARIDMQVMKDAAILPEVYAKSLLYRNSQLTNVFVQPYYAMYNYSTLGLK